MVAKETVKAVVIETHRRGWQLYLHIGTPESFDNATEALEEAYRMYPREDARHIFTHIGMPTQANLDTMARLGVTADLQTSGYYLRPDDSLERNQVNPERPDFGPNPVATYRDAGIPVILSSDQAPLGPLFSVQEAVTRVVRSGKVFRPEERITLEEGIRAVTSTSAWAFFEGDVKGSIEAGKYADMVVLGERYSHHPSRRDQGHPDSDDHDQWKVCLRQSQPGSRAGDELPPLPGEDPLPGRRALRGFILPPWSSKSQLMDGL